MEIIFSSDNFHDLTGRKYFHELYVIHLLYLFHLHFIGIMFPDCLSSSVIIRHIYMMKSTASEIGELLFTHLPINREKLRRLRWRKPCFFNNKLFQICLKAFGVKFHRWLSP